MRSTPPTNKRVDDDRALLEQHLNATATMERRMKNRITPADIDAAIAKVEYLVLPDGRTTLAQVTCMNGYTLLGESSCVDIANFDAALGQKLSLEDAKKKLWPLLGYELKSQIAALKQASMQNQKIQADLSVQLSMAPQTTGLTFSAALIELKAGNKVARAGWNGKGQWVAIVRTSRGLFDASGSSYHLNDCLGLKNAQGEMQPGWVPSMGDLLASDWLIVE